MNETPEWVWDAGRLRIVQANAAALELWGAANARELAERPFAPDGPVAQAMTAIDARLKAGAARTRLTLTPSGTPQRFDVETAAATLDDGRAGLKIRARPATTGDDAEAEAERLRDILERAPSALALFAEDGAALWGNAAARQLFLRRPPAPNWPLSTDGADLGVVADRPGPTAEPDLTERYQDPNLGRRALSAALRDGAFAHAADLSTPMGSQRAQISLQRMLDPVSTAPCVLVAFLNPSPAESKADIEPETAPPATPAADAERTNAPPADAIEGTEDLRLGAFAAEAARAALIVFGARSGALRFANPEAREILGVDPRGRGDAKWLRGFDRRNLTALREALAALFSGQESVIDLDLNEPAAQPRLDRGAPATLGERSGGDRRTAAQDGRNEIEPAGPWLAAALRAHVGPAADVVSVDPSVALTVFDVGPERRALVRVSRDVEARRALLARIGVVTAVVDADGRIVVADPGFAAAADARSAALSGRAIADFLDPASAAKLSLYLKAGPLVGGRALEDGIDAWFGPRRLGGEEEGDGRRPARLAVGGRSASTPDGRLVALALTPPGSNPKERAPTPAPQGALTEDELARLRKLDHELRAAVNALTGFVALLRDETDDVAARRRRLDDLTAAADRTRAALELSPARRRDGDLIDTDHVASDAAAQTPSGSTSATETAGAPTAEDRDARAQPEEIYDADEIDLATEAAQAVRAARGEAERRGVRLEFRAQPTVSARTRRPAPPSGAPTPNDSAARRALEALLLHAMLTAGPGRRVEVIARPDQDAADETDDGGRVVEVRSAFDVAPEDRAELRRAQARALAEAFAADAVALSWRLADAFAAQAGLELRRERARADETAGDAVVLGPRRRRLSG